MQVNMWQTRIFSDTNRHGLETESNDFLASLKTHTKDGKIIPDPIVTYCATPRDNSSNPTHNLCIQYWKEKDWYSSANCRVEGVA